MTPGEKAPARVLCFGGTCETHELAARLAALGCDLTMSVASDYGRTLLPPDSERFHVLSGPMLPDAIEARLRSGGYCCVVDATHPYATSVSRHVAEKAELVGIPYLRLLRDPSDLDGCTVVPDMDAAAALLAQSDVRVLLTTGSKDLPAFTAVPDYAERIYPRLLPTTASVERALSLGYRVDHLIAMQGPFGYEFNRALISQLGVGCLVTKDGGTQGGFAEKVLAAKDAGVEVVVIERPEDLPGMTIDDLVARVAELVRK